MTCQAIATWEDEFAKKLEADNFANSPNFDPSIYNQQGCYSDSSPVRVSNTKC